MMTDQRQVIDMEQRMRAYRRIEPEFLLPVSSCAEGAVTSGPAFDDLPDDIEERRRWR